MAPPGGEQPLMPMPGSFATPPQDSGCDGKHVQSRLIQPGCERHTTQANVNVFFNPETYRNRGGEPGGSVQKRSAESPTSAPPSKTRSMGKVELLEKFKLAAELNGFSLDELVVPWTQVSVCGVKVRLYGSLGIGFAR